jgi:flagellar motor switch protein FliN/FliY
MAETAQATEEQTAKQTQADAAQDDTKIEAQSVEFSEAPSTDAPGAGTNIDILLDMNVPVTVAVGKTEITVQRLLQLGPGSVLKLNKPIDAPADLYIKDVKFAAGNIVLIDNCFAVRIKEILGTGIATRSAEE